MQVKVFQPFAQATDSTARLFGGTGLGLSIVQQYIQLMGGTVGLFSEAGRGTTAWFSLPVEQQNATSDHEYA